MRKDSDEAPTSFQVGGITVQSLEPRRGVYREPDTEEEGSPDGTHVCARASPTRHEAAGDDTRQGARAVGDAQHSCISSGADTYQYHEEKPSFNHLAKSSYYFRYLEEKDEDGGHTSNKDAERRGFAYRPHPADVVIHSWGPNLSAAFQRAGLALFNYMTDIQLVQQNQTRRVVARGSDMKSLLFNFLTELLNLYGEDYFVASEIHVESMDEHTFTIVAEAKGEKFDSTRHSSGTEVKAITMHDMGIWQKKISPGLSTCGDYDIEDYEKDRCVELFIAIDI
eukprot:XP_028356313.1 uncharacterized protein LOC114487882 [Physeter catodon]